MTEAPKGQEPQAEEEGEPIFLFVMLRLLAYLIALFVKNDALEVPLVTLEVSAESPGKKSKTRLVPDGLKTMSEATASLLNPEAKKKKKKILAADATSAAPDVTPDKKVNHV